MKTIPWLFFISCFFLFELPVTLMGQTFTSGVNNHTEYYLASPLTTRDAFRQIQSCINIDGLRNDTVFGYATVAQLQLLTQKKIAYTLLPHPGIQPMAVMSDEILSVKNLWNTYPTYEAYVAQMEAYAAQYPELCTLVVHDTLNSGHHLLAIRIDKGAGPTDTRPKIFYTSTIHGDETVGYVLLLRLIDYLLSGYGENDTVTFLIDHINIMINPLANPDGTYYSGNYTVSGSRRYNAANVDLNRNFPDPQDGPHPDNKPWQEETVAFMALAEAEAFDLSVNIHGGAEGCNYPWDTWSTAPADAAWWLYVCNQYADTAQYYSPAGYMDDFGTGVTNGYAWYSINGGRQDYMNYFQSCREFTLELSGVKNPPSAQLPAFWNYSYRSFLNYMRQAWFGVHGMITDSVSGLPLRAKVYIDGHDTDSSWVFSSGLAGDYHRYLKAGDYTLTFSSPGYVSKTVLVTVEEEQHTDLNITLVPSGYVAPIMHTVFLPEGWSAFSTWLNLLNDSTDFWFEPLEDSLIILKNLTSVYWPPHINNLPQISPYSGYAIKMEHPVTIQFTGNAPDSTTLLLPEGWSYLPVIVSDSISSAVLFATILEHIIIVKSFNGDQIFWPSAMINTMPWLYAGRAYLIKVEKNCVLTY
ncbi:MAG: DUF2817 domain-containing protein [Bacteroidales bacterium]|nr:DUF2817 domain-containing protein [Bacteroidales bacterium]